MSGSGKSLIGVWLYRNAHSLAGTNLGVPDWTVRDAENNVAPGFVHQQVLIH
jgi:hypothetical protein